MDATFAIEVGTRFGNHVVTRVEDLHHLGGTYYELIHEPTGAKHIHIACADDCKNFNVTFPTVPRTNNGVAHILEHVVLAGSEKYPVRDPFFSMTSRSVRDFMNAMTFPSATAYPFASRNEADFWNLLEVYLDACFFPRISEESFMQEGHRLEFDATEDPKSGLKIKGVVFNEMKGAMATASSVLGRSLGKGLMPGTTFSYNSGGDPEHIPTLTWDELKAFHAVHYHPSNALFYTYGDMNLTELFERIETLALSKFERITPDVEIPVVEAFDAPTRFEATFPLPPGEDPANKTEVCVGWLLRYDSDPFRRLSWKILEQVLLGNDAGPLKHALISSGLGANLSSASGYDDGYKQGYFGAGLQGTNPDSESAVQELVLSTLQAVVDNGLDTELVEAIIHSFELDEREVANSGFPFGLKMWFKLKNSFEYGWDAYSDLNLDPLFARLRDEVKAGPYFENMIRAELLENQHRCTFVVSPDAEMEPRATAKENEKVAQIEAGLSDDDKATIVERTVKLKSEQEAEQDISVLPKISPSDIPLTVEDAEIQITEVAGIPVGLYEAPTNGVAYISVSFDAAHVGGDDLDFIAFNDYLSMLGAGEYDHVAQSLRIEKFTGGVGTGFGVRNLFDGTLSRRVNLSTKTLNGDVAGTFAILGDIIRAPRFDIARLKEIIAMENAATDPRMVQMGQRYAEGLALSWVDEQGHLGFRNWGLARMSLIRRLATGAESVEDFAARLSANVSAVFGRGNARMMVTADADGIKAVTDQIAGLVDGLPEITVTPAELPAPTRGSKFHAYTCAAPVNYNAKAWKTVSYDHPDSAALAVLGPFLRSSFLHREIRERGGAYGSHSGANTRGGLFTMWSYRDPHVTRTYKTFEDAVEYAANGKHDAADIEEAVLQALKGLDPLQGPNEKGSAAFRNHNDGFTVQIREQFKRRVAEVTDEDLRRVAASHLTKEASFGTIGSAPKIEEGNAELGGIFEVKQV